MPPNRKTPRRKPIQRNRQQEHIRFIRQHIPGIDASVAKLFAGRWIQNNTPEHIRLAETKQLQSRMRHAKEIHDAFKNK